MPPQNSKNEQCANQACREQQGSLFLKHSWSLKLLSLFTKTEQPVKPSPISEYLSLRWLQVAVQGDGHHIVLICIKFLSLHQGKHNSAEWARWPWETARQQINTVVSLLYKSPICPLALQLGHEGLLRAAACADCIGLRSVYTGKTLSEVASSL